MASNSERRRQFFKSFEAKSLKSRSLLTQISDDLTEICGSTSFLVLHIFYISAWIVLNLGLIPGLYIFDPFPFGLLTMVLSVEAIFLAIFILVSQLRSSSVATIRDEVSMQVNLIAEEEITKVLEVLGEMRAEMGIKRRDSELEEMLKRIDTNYIERRIIDQLEKAKSPMLPELLRDFPELMVKKPLEAMQNLTTLTLEEKTPQKD